MFIDTHSHLYDEKFKDNIDKIITNALESKVEKIIVAGTDIESCKQTLHLAEKYDCLYASVGFYPQYVEKYNEKELINLAKNKKVVAIGEIGIDKTYDVSLDKQKEVFLKQLRLACELHLPVVIHGRESYGEIVNILKANKELLKFGGTFHCYTGSKELAKEIVKLGFCISVGGVSTFANSTNVKEMIKSLPLENLILETDCPYLAPVPMRGRVNQPAYIPYIAQNLAELKGVSVEKIEEITTKNAKRLFNL